jgi:drug/metabolite transporter (DMT)-like permease
MANSEREHEPVGAPGTGDSQAPVSSVAHYFSKLNPLQLHKRGRRTKAFFALALVCFFWGTTWIASKQGVQHMPALEMAGIRQFIGGLLYFIFFVIKGARFPRGKEWGPILMLSFLNFMLSNALSTWGVKYISAGLGSIIGAIFPLWLVIIALIGSKMKVHRKTVVGLLLGFTGICVIFYEHLSDFLEPDFRFGILLSVASTWSWAIGTLYTKKQAANFNPYFSLGLQMLISGGVLMAGTFISGNAISFTAIPWQAWAAIGYLVVFGSVVAFIAYIYALQNLTTDQVSLYAYINPIVAVLLGWILFNEKLTGFIICGTLITLLGVWLVNHAALKSFMSGKNQRTEVKKS